MTDPIADMITRMRNGYLARKHTVEMPHSRTKENIATVLKTENFIENYEVIGDAPKRNLKLTLKYVSGEPAVSRVVRASKPGRRTYTRARKLQTPLSGYGVTIVSTSKGIMTNKAAAKLNLGGEVLCHIY